MVPCASWGGPGTVPDRAVWLACAVWNAIREGEVACACGAHGPDGAIHDGWRGRRGRGNVDNLLAAWVLAYENQGDCCGI